MNKGMEHMAKYNTLISDNILRSLRRYVDGDYNQTVASFWKSRITVTM